MHGQTLRNWAATAALLVPIVIGIALLHAADQQSGTSKGQARRGRSGAVDTRHPHPEYNIRYRGPTDVQVSSLPGESERSIVNPSSDRVSPFLSGSSAYAPPPPSPGLVFAKTGHDLQHFHSSGYQTGRVSGANIVHFTWTHWNKIPPSIENADRFVHYNSYTVSTGTFNQGFDGCLVSLGVTARGGYTNLGIGSQNDVHTFEHQRPEEGLPYTTYAHWYPSPGSCLHIDNEMATNGVFGEVLWPHGAVQRNGIDQDVVHVVAHGPAPYGNEAGSWDRAERIVYWRYSFGSGIWEGPVAIDSSFTLGYVVAADPNSNGAAIVLHTDREPQFGGLNNIAYYESANEGTDWINGFALGDANKTIITNYTDPFGPQAWLHISAAFDNDGTLNIVWDEQRYANVTADVAIRHWNDVRNTIRPVAFGYWPSPMSSGTYNLNLSKLTLGIGDGSTTCGGGTNRNFLYVLYTKFAGETAVEQADYSALNYYNGELVLNVSNSSGLTWSPPLNLTNTKTPGCNPGPGTPANPDPPRPDSVCRSENWATLGEIVDDIDIFFISDLDAGAIVHNEGTWQMNPVHYLRIADSDTICPLIAPVFAGFLSGRTDCEYHAAPGASTTENLTVINLGNATMTGSISKTQFNGPPFWLTVAGLGGYTIPAGDPDLTPLVTMSAAGVADGTLLRGQIAVTHNDPSKVSPQLFPVNFFVFNEFYCPENEVLRTGVASPGSLGLQVESNGRYGSQNDKGGLFRYGDSSSAIFDASFLLAYGSQSPDTIVFHRFGDRGDPGQFGWRAQSNLEIDSSAYLPPHQGAAIATAAMSTKDSVIGVDVTWYFPQHADSDEFIIGRWRIYSHDGAAHSNVIVGLLEDQDIVPAAKWGQVQNGVDNLPGSDINKRLIWQRGTDTINHPPNPVVTATRYRGGLRLIGDYPLPGAIVGNSANDLQPGGGPSSGFLYRGLTASGIDMFVDSVNGTDLYSLMVLARGFSVGAADTKDLESVGDTVDVVAALVSDTLSETSFKANADKAEAWARGRGIVSGWVSCVCTPCFANPACDDVLDVRDLLKVLEVAYCGGVEVQDPSCRKSRTDVNCDGVTSVLDVLAVYSVAVSGGNPAVIFCNPCASLYETVGQTRLVKRDTSDPPATPSYPRTSGVSGANTVTIESKQVSPDATGVQVGISVTNDMTVAVLVFPLEFRSITPGSFISGSLSATMPAVNRAGSALSLGTNRYANPGGVSCSGPVSNTYTSPAPLNFVSPDAIRLTGLEGAGCSRLPPGSDPPGTASASFLLTFNVTGVPGSFVIDTCCVRPANHLCFVDEFNNLIVPAFTPGVITIASGGPVLDCNRSLTDRYLLACPKGDIAFEVRLVGTDGLPWVGESNVWLDFSSCTAGEFLPQPGLYPLWPRVNATAPSDANGIIRFAIAAGGNCADCQVTVNAGCGVIATVPVRSVDVDGDAWVLPFDADSARGICRDVNADGTVDSDDLDRLSNHLEHKYPTGNCDWLGQTITPDPDAGFDPGDTITILYTLENNPAGGTCRIDSIVFYQGDFSVTPSWEYLTTLAPGLFLPRGATYANSLSNVVPPAGRMCLRTLLYSSCCTQPQEALRCVDNDVECPPDAVCYEFKANALAGADQPIREVRSIPLGWISYVEPRPPDTTLYVICTDANTSIGTTGTVTVYYHISAGWRSFRFSVRQDYRNGDLCGGPSGAVDCIVNVQDVVCLVNYVFRGGTGVIPNPVEHGDINCDGTYNVLDVVGLVNYVFRGGAPPEDCGAGPRAE